MRIELLDKKENYKFVVENTTASFMNEIRRAFMFELPVLAIEDVYFTKNTSALYDEMIAHRLGLLPLKADLKKKDEEVRFILKAKGPCMVYAKDLKCKNKNVKMLYPEMPVVLLEKDQEIDLQAVAVLGVGKEHMKWSPGLAFYQRYPKIDIKKTNIEATKHCPRDVFDNKGKVINLLNCNLCRSCQDRSNGAISIDGDDSKYIFTLESWGQIEPKDAMKRVCDIISKKLKEVRL